jgi:hypothetical protein
MGNQSKRLLLIDYDADSGVRYADALIAADFDVDLRLGSVPAEQIQDEGPLDLVVLILEPDSERTANYSDQLREASPALPILVIGDSPGGYCIRGRVGPETMRLYKTVSSLLTGSNHVQEVPPEMIPSVWHSVV